MSGFVSFHLVVYVGDTSRPGDAQELLITEAGAWWSLDLYCSSRRHRTLDRSPQRRRPRDLAGTLPPQVVAGIGTRRGVARASLSAPCRRREQSPLLTARILVPGGVSRLVDRWEVADDVSTGPRCRAERAMAVAVPRKLRRPHRRGRSGRERFYRWIHRVVGREIGPHTLLCAESCFRDPGGRGRLACLKPRRLRMDSGNAGNHHDCQRSRPPGRQPSHPKLLARVGIGSHCVDPTGAVRRGASATIPPAGRLTAQHRCRSCDQRRHRPARTTAQPQVVDRIDAASVEGSATGSLSLDMSRIPMLAELGRVGPKSKGISQSAC
jgi:hypothetical protein